MISLIRIGLLLLSWSHAAQALEVKVFLLGGQSNSVGQAPSSGLPTVPVNLQAAQPDVLFFHTGSGLVTLGPGSGGNPNPSGAHFGPEITFGRTLADASPSTAYAIIKHGENGTALYNDWAPETGASYLALQDTVAKGLAALEAAGHVTEIVGMLWHQGESDALEGRQADYATNLTAFIADIRSRYGADLPFLIGEIRRRNAAYITVADAQVAVAAADPMSHFVKASDLSFLDANHLDAPSQIILGERFAAGYAALVDPGDPDGPAITGVSIADVSSEFNANRPATNLIDGTGFTEANGHHVATDFGLWNNLGEGLASTPGDDPFPIHVTLDLGANHDLDSVRIWNWNHSGTLTAGARDIVILVSPDAGGTFTSLGGFVLARAPGVGDQDFGQRIDLGGLPGTGNVRLVRIEITSNHGFNFQLAGLSEIRFFGEPVAADGYAAYISNPAFGLDPAHQGFDDDPDDDGIKNGIEAWFGTNPAEFSVGLEAVSTNLIQSRFHHPQTPDPPTDVSVVYEWSIDLVNWYAADGMDGPEEGAIRVVSNAATDVAGTAVMTTASDPLPAFFFRLNARWE